MSLKKKFGTDKEAIENGSWIEICENSDGSVCRIRIKRMNQQNVRFHKEIANHRNAFTSNHDSAKKISQMQASMIEVLISTVIVGWENVERWETVEEGVEGFPQSKFLEYNAKNVRAALVEFPDLLDLITAQATDITTFQEKVKEEEVKN